MNGREPAPAASSPKSARQWWQHAVFYEIYVRSFADSNNDGIGDLGGILTRLDYLQELGIDAIWLTPCSPSSQLDFGYDVTDYQNIHPDYGTLEDFDRLVREAEKRRIRLVLDLVLNHSSDRHPWFLDSRSSRNAKHRHWYIWREGRAAGEPPNNWRSAFGGSAWEFDPTTRQYYYHSFFKQQPDLNWRNPAVKKAMFDVVRFWLDRGVAGFRLDAVANLFKHPQFPDNPERGELNWIGDRAQEHIHDRNLPEVHGLLRELRQLVDGYGDCVLIGETTADVLTGESTQMEVTELSRYYGATDDEIHLPMNFFFACINELSSDKFRQQVALSNGKRADGWPLYFLSNHDLARHCHRYGDGKHNDAIAKLTAALLLTLRGTPLLYYGEEIGMANNDPSSLGEVKDPLGRLYWPFHRGRDGQRTPMQWDTSACAGFSSVEPWLPIPSDYRSRNVARQANDPGSILRFYRQLIALRRRSPALTDGEYIALNELDENVLAYLRKHPNETVLVALNMSGTRQEVHFDPQLPGVSPTKATTLCTTTPGQRKTEKLDSLCLDPFEARIARVD